MIAHRKFIQFCTVHHFSQPDINLLASAYAFHQIQQKLSPEHLSSCLYITYGKIRTTNISNSVSLWLSQTDELRTLVHCVCVCKCEQWLFHCPSLSLSNFCVCFTLYIYFSFYKIRIDRIAYPTIFSVHIYVKPKNDDDNLSNTFTINQTKETILIVNGNIESVESFFFYITKIKTVQCICAFSNGFFFFGIQVSFKYFFICSSYFWIWNYYQKTAEKKQFLFELGFVNSITALCERKLRYKDNKHVYVCRKCEVKLCVMCNYI